jgi:hypothetical protein
MRRMPAVSLAVSLGLALALGACASDGGASLYSMAPPGVEAKIVLLQIDYTDRATLTVGSEAVDALQRRQGVFGVRRARARNQVYVCCDAMTDPGALVDSMGQDYNVRVVSVTYPEGAKGGN